MVQNIMRDVFFLSQKSEPATGTDRQVALDMQKHQQKFSGWTAQIIQHECE